MGDYLQALLDEWEEGYEDTLGRLGDMGEVDTVPVNGFVPIMAVESFDPNTNIYEAGVSFPESIAAPTTHLTKILPTTVTLGGTITNVGFREEEFVNIVEPNENIIMIKCNYGVKCLAGYTPPIKRHMQKNPKRKKQGNGTAMCSQMSFHCRKLDAKPIDGVYPPNTRVYKVKVFRNGYAQVPGARPDTIEEIRVVMEWVVSLLNAYLHPAETMPERLCRVINLNPLMYNYKAQLIIPAGRYFARRELLRAVETAEYINEYPQLTTAQYSQKEPKISFRFQNKIDGFTKDPLFVFYDSGCFNIQGAADLSQCTRSCEFLARVIADNAHRIFAQPADPIDYFPDNISWPQDN
jgi:hypothetical protein